MASTYSSDLKLEIVATGEKAGLWGTITNTNLKILEQSASGYQCRYGWCKCYFRFNRWCNIKW